MDRSRALYVSRTDLSRVRLEESWPPEPGPGEALFEVERFGVSANNVTYALLGDTLGYWDLFPAASGWGQIPVWGYLRAVTSRHPGIPQGSRVFGLCPMATHVLMRPGRADGTGFRESSPHRAAMPAAYGSYFRAGRDASGRLDDLLTVLRPVFWLSFTLDQYLAEHEPGASGVIITSASSKAGIGLAHLVGRRGLPAIGLTSASHASLAQATGVYDHVVSYRQVGALAGLGGSRPVLVDVAGRPALRQEAGRYLGGQPGPVLVAGRTHSDVPDDGSGLFSAPQQIRALSRRWGWPDLDQRFSAALAAFAGSATWLAVETAHGLDGAARTYQRVLGNDSSPALAHVVDLTGAAA